MYAPGSPGDCRCFGMDRLIFALVSMNALSSKMALSSRSNSPMVFAVLLRRYANLFVAAESAAACAAFVEAKKPAGVFEMDWTIAEEAGTTEFFRATCCDPAERSKSHAPAMQSRQTKIQIVRRERIQ